MHKSIDQAVPPYTSHNFPPSSFSLLVRLVGFPKMGMFPVHQLISCKTMAVSSPLNQLISYGCFQACTGNITRWIFRAEVGPGPGSNNGLPELDECLENFCCHDYSLFPRFQTSWKEALFCHRETLEAERRDFTGESYINHHTHYLYNGMKGWRMTHIPSGLLP